LAATADREQVEVGEISGLPLAGKAASKAGQVATWGSYSCWVPGLAASGWCNVMKGIVN
jgi:hypothetical protein